MGNTRSLTPTTYASEESAEAHITISQAFVDYYRCPDQFVNFTCAGGNSTRTGPGDFRLGPDVVCYGTTQAHGNDRVADELPDALNDIQVKDSEIVLPFNPTEVANNLRLERYVTAVRPPWWKELTRQLYYAIRPCLSVSFRRHLQRWSLGAWATRPFPRWPVDHTVDRMFEVLMQLTLTSSEKARIPFIWFWPEAKASCMIMTHDVETAAGLAFTQTLMNINETFGIRSSFQLIPDARYVVTDDILSEIRRRGCEVNVHDLKHDGHLFEEYQSFLQSAELINEYAVRFQSKGFRSGALYRNLDWYEAFRFSYDMSVPNVGHLDPQAGGCCTVMPYFIGNILELPVTATQDYSLFHIIGTTAVDLWREQIRNIVAQHGLVSFIVHPDYLDSKEARAAYQTLLSDLSNLGDNGNVWAALPGEVDEWWRQRHRMTLVPDGTNWRIEGPGSERARVAYATLTNGQLTYSLDTALTGCKSTTDSMNKARSV